jgi:hypothetical protein
MIDPFENEENEENEGNEGNEENEENGRSPSLSQVDCFAILSEAQPTTVILSEAQPSRRISS